VIPGLAELMSEVPERPVPFPGTQFPFPVSQALFGCAPDPAALRRRAGELEQSEASPHEAAWTVLSAAEAAASVASDRQQRFISDGTFRGLVFTGIKWRAGWALLLGDGQQQYGRVFAGADFIVFATRAGVEDARFLGDSAIASVYFAQLLARYALLYSDVQPGDLHELTHFVEDHGPGVVVACGAMGPVESLLCLSLMRLGMPALVTSEFPWDIGHRVEVDSPQQALAAAAGFDNLRIRSQHEPLSALPAYANPAYANEKFDPVRLLGGSDRCFFFLCRGAAEEGISVIGEISGEVGVLITVDDPTLDGPAAIELEGAAAEYLNMLPGLRLHSAQPFTIALRELPGPSPEQMAEVVRRGLRLEYPRLGAVHVAVIGDPSRLAALAPEVAAGREARRQEVRKLSEAPMSEIYSCEACAPFSREHLCLAHPLRAPMCGRRWTEMLVGARYMAVSAGRPWRRRGRPENCCTVVPLGRCLDPLRGEYEGLNQFLRQATGGRMQRAFLHSLREHPHSSCGCFYALAWWSDELNGIAVMHRGFEGVAPDGSTWNSLANRAGGKQQPGITGVGLSYMRSPRFLQGDGGWAAVKWITSKLKGELQESLPEVGAIPSELD